MTRTPDKFADDITYISADQLDPPTIPTTDPGSMPIDPLALGSSTQVLEDPPRIKKPNEVYFRGRIMPFDECLIGGDFNNVNPLYKKKHPIVDKPTSDECSVEVEPFAPPYTSTPASNPTSPAGVSPNKNSDTSVQASKPTEATPPEATIISDVESFLEAEIATTEPIDQASKTEDVAIDPTNRDPASI